MKFTIETTGKKKRRERERETDRQRERGKKFRQGISGIFEKNSGSEIDRFRFSGIKRGKLES